jgi:hypothetical protein
MYDVSIQWGTYTEAFAVEYHESNKNEPLLKIYPNLDNRLLFTSE